MTATRLGFGSALLLAAISATSHEPDARACGGFFRPRAEGRLPSLSHEQALIVHDAKTSTEHFVRDVTFEGATTVFGFVVPTPTRPSITKIDASPFTTLHRLFPFDANLKVGSGGGAVQGGGGMRGGAPGGVTVLEIKKVGSFTAFVLQATDAKGLADWLAKNQLVSTPEADTWLAHYVKMKFFYVALRYDPPAAATAGVKAETMDISFQTPIPYYPYFEPARRADAAKDPRRLLELYTITSAPVLPVAYFEKDGKREWVRPLQSGITYRDGTGRLFGSIGNGLDGSSFDPAIAKYLPAAGTPRVVQVFQDQKVSRAGYGDVLFVPGTPEAPDPKRDAALAPLLGVLDPALEGGAP